MSSTRSGSASTPSTPNSKSNKFAFKQNSFLVGVSSMDTTSSHNSNNNRDNHHNHHHGKLSKSNSSSSSSSDKHISFNLSNNIVIGSGGGGGGSGENSPTNSTNDLKLASFVHEPTTPIDKLNTPGTVTVKTTFFPPSPPPIADNDLSSLTGNNSAPFYISIDLKLGTGISCHVGKCV
jgi:hypothetical protein